MDAKSKMRFINSINESAEILCPSCGTANMPTSNFCKSCGFPLKKPSNAIDDADMKGDQEDGEEVIRLPDDDSSIDSLVAERTDLGRDTEARVSSQESHAVEGLSDIAFSPIDEPAEKRHDSEVGAVGISPNATADGTNGNVVSEVRSSKPNGGLAFASDESENGSKRMPVMENAATKLDDDTELAFARGLPDWDVVPPHVVVRRKNGKR